eukprot:822007-Prymnesium_polylepis.1
MAIGSSSVEQLPLDAAAGSNVLPRPGPARAWSLDGPVPEHWSWRLDGAAARFDWGSRCSVGANRRDTPSALVEWDKSKIVKHQ